jgi:hypothetical protein
MAGIVVSLLLCWCSCWHRLPAARQLHPVLCCACCCSPCKQLPQVLQHREALQPVDHKAEGGLHSQLISTHVQQLLGKVHITLPLPDWPHFCTSDTADKLAGARRLLRLLHCVCSTCVAQADALCCDIHISVDISSSSKPQHASLPTAVASLLLTCAASASSGYMVLMAVRRG